MLSIGIDAEHIIGEPGKDITITANMQGLETCNPKEGERCQNFERTQGSSINCKLDAAIHRKDASEIEKLMDNANNNCPVIRILTMLQALEASAIK